MLLTELRVDELYSSRNEVCFNVWGVKDQNLPCVLLFFPNGTTSLLCSLDRFEACMAVSDRLSGGALEVG